MLGIHVAEVFVGYTVLLHGSTRVFSYSHFAGSGIFHEPYGIEVSVRSALFEFDFQPAEVTHVDFVDIFLTVLLAGHREDFVVVVGIVEIGDPAEIVVGSEDIGCGQLDTLIADFTTVDIHVFTTRTFVFHELVFHDGIIVGGLQRDGAIEQTDVESGFERLRGFGFRVFEVHDTAVDDSSRRRIAFCRCEEKAVRNGVTHLGVRSP